MGKSIFKKTLSTLVENRHELTLKTWVGNSTGNAHMQSTLINKNDKIKKKNNGTYRDKMEKETKVQMIIKFV